MFRGMSIDPFALFGALVTAIGVILVGAGSTGGYLLPWSEKPLGGKCLWDWINLFGTASGIVGAGLLLIAVF